MKYDLLKTACLICILSSIFQIGCKDTTSSSVHSGPEVAVQNVVSPLRVIKTTDSDFMTILNSEELQGVLNGFDNPDIKTILTDYTDTSDISNYVINISPVNGIQRDIFISSKKVKDGNFIVPFIRLHNVISNGRRETYNGKVKWYTFNGVELNELAFVKGKIDKFAIYDVSKKNAKAPGCAWNCTNAQFNAAYQAAKNSCESDWLCDVACTFTPCAVSYVASATISCTTCSLSRLINDSNDVQKGSLNNLTDNFN